MFWNEFLVYKLIVRRPAWALSSQWLNEPRLEWQIVDVVNGGSMGLVIGETFSLRSSNFATLQAVSGGRNLLRVAMTNSEGDLEGSRVVVSSDSQVFESSLGPSTIVVDGHGSVDGGIVAISAKLRNMGMTSQEITPIILIYYSDGSRTSVAGDPLRPLNPNESMEIESEFELPRADPAGIQFIVDWDAGQSVPIDIYPQASGEGSNKIGQLPLRLGGAIMAFIVAWISIPAVVKGLVSAVRRGSSQPR
jgi:hypothetical protein